MRASPPARRSRPLGTTTCGCPSVTVPAPAPTWVRACPRPHAIQARDTQRVVAGVVSWHRRRQRRGSRIACRRLRRPARGSSAAADLVLDAPGVREDARPWCSAKHHDHREAGGVCDDSGLGADRANSRPASRKRRQKGEDGAFAAVLLADLDALQAQRCQHRSRIRRSRLIRRTSRQPRVVQEVRVGNAPRDRKSRSHAGFRASDGETRTRTGDTTIFSRAVESLERQGNRWKTWGF
jgi:hypothetical protein